MSIAIGFIQLHPSPCSSPDMCASGLFVFFSYSLNIERRSSRPISEQFKACPNWCIVCTHSYSLWWALEMSMQAAALPWSAQSARPASGKERFRKEWHSWSSSHHLLPKPDQVRVSSTTLKPHPVATQVTQGMEDFCNARRRRLSIGLQTEGMQDCWYFCSVHTVLLIFLRELAKGNSVSNPDECPTLTII